MMSKSERFVFHDIMKWLVQVRADLSYESITVGGQQYRLNNEQDRALLYELWEKST